MCSCASSEPSEHALPRVWRMAVEGTSEDQDAVPEEIEETCLQCHEGLAGVDTLLKPVLAISRTNLEDKLDELDAASLILLLAYTMNSLFWIYLSTQGVSPKSHPIKRELERLQKAMNRAKILSVKRSGAQPTVNTGVAKRLLRGALWDHKTRKRQREEGAESGEESPHTKQAATDQ